MILYWQIKCDGCMTNIGLMKVSLESSSLKLVHILNMYHQLSINRHPSMLLDNLSFVLTRQYLYNFLLRFIVYISMMCSYLYWQIKCDGCMTNIGLMKVSLESCTSLKYTRYTLQSYICRYGNGCFLITNTSPPITVHGLHVDPTTYEASGGSDDTREGTVMGGEVLVIRPNICHASIALDLPIKVTAHH
jgi:hypothetical protein